MDYPAEEHGGPVLAVDAVSRVNFASAQNAIPLIRTLSIRNNAENAIERLVVRAETKPPLMRPKSWIVDRLGPHDEAEMQRARDVLGISRLSQSARAYILQCDQWRLLNSPGE